MDKFNICEIISNLNTAYLKRISIIERINIYYITIENGNVTGFFALLRSVLDWTCYADEIHFMPYVVYGNTLYSEEKPIKGTKNAFEYYYQQVYNEKKLRLPGQFNLVKAESFHFDKIEYKYNQREFSYYVRDEYINRMAEIYKKYFILKNDVQKHIKSSIKDLLKKKKTLGIHIRGTDFNKAFYNHPIPIPVDDYIFNISQIFDKYHFEQVFVATDDERCLTELKEKLSVPIVYYTDTIRTDIDKSVAFITSKRKNNKYLLGIEALRDVYTLSYCAGFIGCLSQMDIFVQIIKKSREKAFIYKKILDKGIYNTGQACYEPVG